MIKDRFEFPVSFAGTFQFSISKGKTGRDLS